MDAGLQRMKGGSIFIKDEIDYLILYLQSLYFYSLTCLMSRDSDRPRVVTSHLLLLCLLWCYFVLPMGLTPVRKLVVASLWRGLSAPSRTTSLQRRFGCRRCASVKVNSTVLLWVILFGYSKRTVSPTDR